jgi:Tfp pilus assembly protein PilF
MRRTVHSLARTLLAVLLVILPTLSGTPAISQTAPPQDWSGVTPLAARIDVQGPGGAPVRQSYGVVLGDPGRLVVRLSDLAGAEKVLATFPDNSTVTATSVFAIDPKNDIAVLESEGLLPLPPMADQTIKWQYMEKIHVIPGPGMAKDTPELTCGEPLEVDGARLTPIAGDHPAGLLVMHYCGRWIGVTGVIRDPSGSFGYMTTKETILQTLSAKATPKPIAEIAAVSPEWLKPNTAQGLLIRAVLTSFSAPAEAEPFYNLALERDKTVPELHFWMGKNYFKEAKYAEAEVSFREAGRLRPTWAMAFFMGGAAAFQQKKYAEAVQIYNEGLKGSPKSAAIMSNKAAALGNLGRVDEAVLTLKAASEADPTYTMAIYNLGGLYLQMGKRIEAEEQYTKLQKMDPNLAQQLRQQLDTK